MYDKLIFDSVSRATSVSSMSYIQHTTLNIADVVSPASCREQMFQLSTENMYAYTYCRSHYGRGTASTYMHIHTVDHTMVEVQQVQYQLLGTLA